MISNIFFYNTLECPVVWKDLFLSYVWQHIAITVFDFDFCLWIKLVQAYCMSHIESDEALIWMTLEIWYKMLPKSSSHSLTRLSLVQICPEMVFCHPSTQLSHPLDCLPPKPWTTFALARFWASNLTCQTILSLFISWHSDAMTWRWQLEQYFIFFFWVS